MKYFYFSIVFCFLISASKFGIAQKYKTDSLYTVLNETNDSNKQLEVLNELTVYLRRSYPDSALYFGQQAETLAKQLDKKSELAECYKNIGNIYNGKDDFKSAVNYYQKSIKLYREVGDSLGIAKNYNNLGALNRNLGNFRISLEYYQKSLELRKLMNDRIGMGIIFNNIGNVHFYQGNFDLALEYYFKSLDIRNEFNDELGIAGCYNNIGSIYITKEDFSEGIEYFKKALKLYIKFEDKLGKGYTFRNIGNAYFKLKEYSLALEYFNKSLEIDQELKDQLGIATTLNEISKTYNTIHNYSKAKIYAEKSLEIAKETGGLLDKKNAFEQLAVAYEGLYDHKKALEYYKSFLNTKDSIFNIEKVKELESLESKYQLENKQLQIEKLESENALKNVSIEKMRSRLILILIISLAFIAFIIQLLIIRKKLKKKNTTIFEQNEEITSQRNELEKHRNHLEKLVEERTKDLELEKKRAEESDRLKSSFLANMSHEIRTPMNAIIGFSNLLKDESVSNETRMKLVHQINQNGYSLLNLIENILDLAKIETNQIEIRLSEFSLSKIFEEIYFTFHELTNNKDLDLIINQDEGKEIIIKSDYIRLNQIIKLLVDNAIKFTDQGYVEIGIKTTDNNLTIYIKDTGIGMSESQLKTIFARFTKIEDDKRKLYRGAGLGLAICHQLISLLGGEISVESEINKGTTFYIIIPDSKIKISEIVHKDSLSNSLNFLWPNKTILIAEDDKDNFKFFEMALKSTRAKIVHANNGKEAIDLLNAQTVDIILMDIKMPEMDGIETTKIIRKTYPKIPIIAQTAFSMEDEKRKCMAAGCNDYISKPISKPHLLSLINSYLG